MEVPKDVFECGDICLSGGPMGWGEVVLITILLGLFVYTGVRDVPAVARLENQMLDLLRCWAARLGRLDSHNSQMLQDLDEEKPR